MSRSAVGPLLLGVGLACCAAAALSALSLAVPPMAGAAPVGAPPVPLAGPPCVITGTKTLRPDVVRLGGDITVTLAARFSCPGALPPLHVVLALDGSAALDDAVSNDMKRAVSAFARGLLRSGGAGTEVGVVEVGPIARTLCPLGDNEARVMACVSRVGNTGAMRADGGVMEAMRVLAQRRGRDTSPRREAIVLVASGRSLKECLSLANVWRQAAGQGILLASVCIGRDCPSPCLPGAASSPRWALDVPDPADLPTALGRLEMALTTAAARSLEVRERVGASMDVVADGAVPPAYVASPLVYWGEAWPSGPSVTFTLRLRPTRLGHWPADTEAIASLRAFDGDLRTYTFPVPWVLVIDPSTPPTVTVTAPPPPTSAPTPSPTSTPSPTPTSPYPVPLTLCRELHGRVPPAAIAAAMADPASVAGYGRTCRPGLPAGPSNSYRGSLALQTSSKPYHPVFNGLVWKCGCP